MRWRFPDPSEQQARRRVCERIEAFWSTFRRQEPALRASFGGEAGADLAWLSESLDAIDPALSWELLPAEGDDPWTLAISTEGRRHLGPLVGEILGRAPRDLSWAFLAGRPPRELPEAALSVEQATGRSLDGWRCRVEQGEHHLLSLHYGVPDCVGPGDRDAHIASMMASDALLGGNLFERWVGAVRIHPLASFQGGEPLADLRSLVEQQREVIRQRLSISPVHAAIEQATWTLYKFNPRRRDDYPLRLDLFVGKTMNPDLWRSAHEDVSFYSERFSCLGETFCYLKLDSDEGFVDGGFEDKSEAEDALDEALGDARLGCVIGGGSGLRYGYIDLALLDVAAAAEVIGRVLREGKAPRRSWLLFFDEDLASEWISFRPKTPPPPGMSLPRRTAPPPRHSLPEGHRRRFREGRAASPAARPRPRHGIPRRLSVSAPPFPGRSGVLGGILPWHGACSGGLPWCRPTATRSILPPPARSEQRSRLVPAASPRGRSRSRPPPCPGGSTRLTISRSSPSRSTAR